MTKGGVKERQRKGATARLRAFFLSCFLCGVCKCSSGQEDNEVYGQDRDSQEVKDEPIASTSLQDNLIPTSFWEDDLKSISSLDDDLIPTSNWEDDLIPTTSWKNDLVPFTVWQDEPLPSTRWQWESVPSTRWLDEPMPYTNWQRDPIPSTSWQEERMAYTSLQEPEVPKPLKKTTQRRRWRFRRRRRGKRMREPRHIRLFGDPSWLARVWARVRQCVSDYRQRNRATENRVIEATATMKRIGKRFSEACMENIFYRRARDRRRKAELIYNLRLSIIDEGNRTWATLPLKNDNAPRKVTFKEPFPHHYPQKIIFFGDLPWLRETEFSEPRKLWVVQKEAFLPDTASVDTLLSSGSGTSQLNDRESPVSLLDHSWSESSQLDGSLSETSLLDDSELETSKVDDKEPEASQLDDSESKSETLGETESGPRSIMDTLRDECIIMIVAFDVYFILWFLKVVLCYIQELFTPELPCPF